MKSLRSRKDFSDLRALGKTIRPCSWLLINYAPNTAKDLRLGLTISSGVANSVIRNKLKRWSRDYLRQQKRVLDLDVNLVFLKQKNPKFFKELTRDEFDKALDRFFQKAK